MTAQRISLPASAADLAALLGAELRGDPRVQADRLEPIERSGPGAVTFVRDAAAAHRWSGRPAHVTLASDSLREHPAFGPHTLGERSVLFVPDADLALIALLRALAQPPHRPTGIHPSAGIDPSANIGDNVSIGPGVVVGPGSRLGAGCTIHAGCVIGARVVIGPGCELHPRVVVYDGCSIGARCALHAGCVIGADGFGYRPDPSGRGVLKVPHIGTVEIGDEVEIGANTTIDRAKFGATVIGSGTKIDNLVQIGHNCRIGRCCIICGMAGIAGSVTLGDGVTIAAGVGIADGRTIGSGATLGARAGVMDDVPAGETWLGIPARPARRFFRIIAAIDRLPELLARAKVLLGDEPARKD